MRIKEQIRQGDRRCKGAETRTRPASKRRKLFICLKIVHLFKNHPLILRRKLFIRRRLCLEPLGNKKPVRNVGETTVHPLYVDLWCGSRGTKNFKTWGAHNNNNRQKGRDEREEREKKQRKSKRKREREREMRLRACCGMFVLV